MAFVKYSDKKIAPADDVVVVDRNTALTMQWSLIYDWKPLKDVFYLKYGPISLGIVTVASAYSLCTFYRKRMNLKHYGHFSTYVPSVLLPGALSVVLHKAFVSSNIILKPECIVCSQVKASAIQSTVGIFQPLIMAPLCAYMLANIHSTVRVPTIQKPKELLKFHMKLSRNYYSQTMPLIVAANIVVAMLLTYLEYKNTFAFNEKLNNIEELIMQKESEEANTNSSNE